MSEEMSSIEELRSMIAELSAMKETYQETATKSLKQAEYLKTEINNLITTANDARTKAFDLTRKLRDAERTLEATEKRERDLAEARAAAEEFDALSRELDLLIDTFPWKDRALDHQKIGAKRLALAKRGILGDRPGLGKTLSSLMVADLNSAHKVVVITPPDVASNFVREVHKWTNRFAVSIVGRNKAERDFMLETILPQTEDFVLVVSYSTWRIDLGIVEQILKLSPDMVIADEAHYVKSRETKAFRGLRRLANGNIRCTTCGAMKPPYEPGKVFVCCNEPNYEYEVSNLILMTGTPLVNKPQDLFSLLTIIEPERYQEERKFLDAYCRQDPWTQKWYFRDGGLDVLIKHLSSKFVARTREDAGIVLPPQDVIVHEYDFDEKKYPKQAEVIRNLREKAILVLDKKDDFGQAMVLPQQYVLQLITRQRQAMCWPDGIQFLDPESGAVLYRADAGGESMKADIVEDLIKEITENGERDENGVWIGERVVVFSQFKPNLEELKRRLRAAGIEAETFNGDTPNYIRDRIKEDVDRDATDPKKAKYQVILAHYKVGGVGLNMTGVTNMIVMDEYWNPAGRDQAYARIDRMGQTEDTKVHVIRINKSIDTWMAQLIEEKEEMINGFESQMNLAASMLDALMSGEM